MLKVALRDSSGTNLSSAAITVSLVSVDGWPPPPNTPSSTNLFRYDATLGGYVYNLSTKGMKSGVHVAVVRVAGDPTDHLISFRLR